VHSQSNFPTVSHFVAFQKLHPCCVWTRRTARVNLSALRRDWLRLSWHAK
jgi:hypothetical protein